MFFESLLNLCISILEFKWAKSGDLKRLAKNLCISILEFKYMVLLYFYKKKW